MSYVGSCGYDNCVCYKVREIAAEQDKVKGADNQCETGCERSISDLLSPSSGNRNGNTTVPFTLYCKGSCEPFVGSGVYQQTLNGTSSFECVESPIFRVVGFKDEYSCCATLELLLPATDNGTIPVPGDNEVCSYFPNETITDFQATGICITVDLNNFFGITCLDAVRPLPASEFPPMTPSVPPTSQRG